MRRTGTDGGRDCCAEGGERETCAGGLLAIRGKEACGARSRRYRCCAPEASSWQSADAGLNCYDRAGGEQAQDGTRRPKRETIKLGGAGLWPTYSNKLRCKAAGGRPQVTPQTFVPP